MNIKRHCRAKRILWLCYNLNPFEDSNGFT